MFLVVWALLLLALLTMVAIVIDLGRARDTIRRTQRTADLATLAAGRKLAGVVGAGGTLTVSVAGACSDAFEYIKANTPDLPPTASMSGAGGCSALPTTCTNPSASPPVTGTTPLNAVATNSAPYTITIRYPIPDSEIVDPRYSEPRPADGKMCERMRVTIERNNETFFAGVIGVNNLSAKGTAVIRGFGINQSNQIPALLLLERVGCAVLERQGNAGQQRLIIHAIDANNAGIIQSDSFGLASNVNSASNCSNNASTPNPGPTDRVAWAKATNTNIPGVEIQDCVYTPPGTTCEDPPPAPPDPAGKARTKGQLLLNAVRTGSAYSAYEMGTPCPGSTCGIQAELGGASIASRKVVDNKYLTEVAALKTSSDTVLNNVATVSGLAAMRVPCGDPGAGAPPYCGFKLYPDDYAVSCGAMPPLVTAITDPKVIIKDNCDFSSIGSAVVFASSVKGRYIAAGRIDIGTSRTLSFRNAAELLVAGCSATVSSTGSGSGCGGSATGGQNVGIRVAGNLFVNNNPVATDVPSACPSLTTSYTPGVLVLRTGRFEVSGTLTMCQVTGLMSGIAPASSVAQNTGGTPHSSCTTALPCPRSTPDYLGYLDVQGSVTWVAPNVNTTSERDPTDSAQRFEDLALWTEGSLDSFIKGSAASILDTTGVFYYPNARFELSGSSGATPRDAQFIARRLYFSGTTTYRMRPLPQNSVKTPKPSFTLIR